MNYIEIVAVLFTAISVWLAYKRNMWTWPLGLIGTIGYGVFFLSTSSAANAALQIYYVIQCLYGWYYWNTTKEQNEVIPRTSNLKTALCYSATVCVLYLVIILLNIFVLKMPNDSNTDMDAMTTAISIVASFMLSRKLVDSWILWIVVDALYVYMFILQHSYFSAILYAGLFIVCWFAYFEWAHKASEREIANETV